MSNVLVLFDFSEFSMAALRAAIHWSDATKCGLHLFHHVETLLPGFTPTEFKKSWQEDAEREAETAVSRVLEPLMGDKAESVTIHIVSGHFLPKLLELTGRLSFQLLFLGTKGRGAFSEILSGSFASKVIAHVPLPVAAIPQLYQPTDGYDLLVSVNTALGFRTMGLQRLVRSLDAALTSLELITVLGNEEQVYNVELRLAALAQEFSGVASCKYTVLAGENVYDELTSLMQNRPNSMVVLQKGEDDDMKNIVGKSLVFELIRINEIPLIILP